VINFRSIEWKFFGKRLFNPSTAPEFDLRFASQTDIGKARDHNEDAVLFEIPASPRVLTRRGAIAILADGMGGHAAGEIASQLACSTIRTRYYAGRGCIEDGLRSAIEDANGVIFQAAQKNAVQRGMGTTCVALVIVGASAHYAWVGDSRLYLIRNGSIYRLSEDHTIINQLVKDGLLDSSEAASHPDRNVLSRALGTHQTVEISSSTQSLEVRPGDRFLLCSDGLHDLVPDEDLLRTSQPLDGKRAAQSLVALANDRGGLDNISVIIVEAAERHAVPLEPANPRETRELHRT
jgi:protein phosphatase